VAAPFLPFALPEIGDEEIAEVVDCLRSGWLTTGPRTRQFETEFGGFLGGGVEAIAVNSATSGLHLALEAIGVGPGDEVVVPTYTFTATAEVVRHLGARPVLVDVDPETLNVTPGAVEAALSPRTRAVIPVHFAGLACDIAALRRVTEPRGVRVVEDAAHALPSTTNGEMVGSLASAATVFSFYATKPITTGEGGMVVTRDQDVAARCRVMRLHGISRDVFERYRAERPAWQYDVVAPGYKYNMPDLAAAIGIHQLRKARAYRQRREQIALAYDTAFAGLPVQLPARAPAGDDHAWHLYVLRLAPAAPVGRDELIARLAERGIGTSVHFIPLHLFEYWRSALGHAPGDFPVALAAYQAAVSLPIYTRMTGGDVERVIEAVRELLAS
jgi:dTDP-4-amino-4,6-dideoxygalactose transaminase